MANYYYYSDDELRHSLHSALRKAGTFIKKAGINVRAAGRKAVTSAKKSSIKTESKTGFLKNDGATGISSSEKKYRNEHKTQTNYKAPSTSDKNAVRKSAQKSVKWYSNPIANSQSRETRNSERKSQHAVANKPSSAAVVSKYRSEHPASKLSDEQILRNAGYK